MDGSPAYTAALEQAAYFPQPDLGYLRLSGEDQVAFLQRQTTNDVRLLKSDQALLTVLTSPVARILDVFYLLQEQPGIAVLPLPGRASATAAYLKSRIFFMDKVTLVDDSASFTQVDVLGPQRAAVLARLGLAQPPDDGQVLAWDAPGVGSLRALGLASGFGIGTRLIGAAQAGLALQAALEDAGAACLPPETYQLLRLEAGLPAAGAELSEDYTPLETGLGAAISGSKGCYTGQEIIARQLTYDKVTQSLCGLRLDAPAAPGQRLWSESRAVGEITSCGYSPRLGHIALAVIKRPHNQPGSQLLAGETQPGGTPAQVCALPF